MDKKAKGSRLAIISEVKTPLGLLVLIVLVTEVILGVLASKAKGLDFTILIVGMLLVLCGILFIVFKKQQSLHSEPSVSSNKISIKHDLFIASPMASFDSEDEYKKDRQGILNLIDTFRKECKFKSIIYAGRDIESMSDFDAPDLSVQDDFLALRESLYFAMVLPKKIASSVLVEAGAALAQDKPSIYFVKNRNDLPFLLVQAEMAFSSVKIYEYSKIEDIIKLISRHRKELLPKKT